MYASGYLLFLRESTLMAQPFDDKALALTGEPVPLGDSVGVTTYGYARFSASANGTLAYRIAGGPGAASRIVSYDRTAKQTGSIGPNGSYNTIALSPDGKRLAVERSEQNGSDLWLYETTPGGKAERFTFDPGREITPLWSPDGATIVFSSTRDGTFNLYRKPTNGAGAETLLFKSSEPKVAEDWSRDGRTLIIAAQTKQAGVDILTLPAQGDRTASVFLSTPFVEAEARLSRDGRWLAYSSNESGRSEIYVRPFPLSSDREGKYCMGRLGGRKDVRGPQTGREPGGRAVHAGAQLDVADQEIAPTPRDRPASAIRSAVNGYCVFDPRVAWWVSFRWSWHDVPLGGAPDLTLRR